MKRNNKKGFTIIELVVVIAVIAILAAVLIPTFSSIIKKAKISNDTQLVKNLNTALAADTDSHKTMTDALAAAAEFGYDVAKINASATDNEILWDSANDLFCYLNDKKIEYIPEFSPSTTPADYQYWAIYEEFPTNQTYSVYWNGGDNQTISNLTVGFDSGVSTGNNITYIGTVTVDIRTNDSDNLTVNAATATVNHYGKGNIVTITAINEQSYHEFGNVFEIRLASGRVVIESGAKVNAIIVTSNDNQVKIDAENGSDVGGVGATDGNLNGVNITGVESSKISSTAPSTEFAGGLGTKTAPYLIEDASQLAKMAGDESNVAYYVLIKDFECSAAITLKTCNIDLDLNNHTLKFAKGEAFILGEENNESAAMAAMNIYNGKIEAANTVFSICGNNPKITISGCYLKAENGYYTVCTNGSTTKNATINISNTTMDARWAIYLPSSGNYTLTNNSVYGYVVIRGGNTVIDGGTYYSPFGGYNVDYSTDDLKLNYMSTNSTGASAIGAAITVIRSEGYEFKSCIIKNITIKFSISAAAGKYVKANAIEAYDLTGKNFTQEEFFTANVTVESSDTTTGNTVTIVKSRSGQ